MNQPNGTQAVCTYLTNNWLSSITHENASGPFLSTSSLYLRPQRQPPQPHRLLGDDHVLLLYPEPVDADHLSRPTETWSWPYDQAGNRTSQTALRSQTGYTYVKRLFGINDDFVSRLLNRFGGKRP